MNEIIFFSVMLLATMTLAQIPIYTGPSYTGPFNSHGIYGPYGTYGPSGFYNRIGTGPYNSGGNFGQGLNPSIYHIANSFFSRIQKRIETAYISAAQVSSANAILSDAVHNFKICENEYILTPVIHNYKTCLQTSVNKAHEDIRVLEASNQPYNFNGNIPYPYVQVRPLGTVERSPPVSSNNIKKVAESREVKDDLSDELKE